MLGTDIDIDIDILARGEEMKYFRFELPSYPPSPVQPLPNVKREHAPESFHPSSESSFTAAMTATRR